MQPRSDLFAAAQSGDLEWIRGALHHDSSSIDQLDQKRWSALHHAADRGYRAVCEELLVAGADPNVRSGELVKAGDLRRDWYWEPGDTPLILAAAKRHRDVADLLLGSGGDVRIGNRWGWKALHAAVVSKDAQLVATFLTHGADPDVWCQMRNFDEELGWYTYGTALHVAALYGASDAARVLLHQGAVERGCLLTARTPLMYAAAAGQAEVIGVLCEHGSPPNVREHRYEYDAFLDYAPLHYAARNGHLAAVAFLLAHGAERRVRDSYSGQTALEMAEDAGFSEIIEILTAKPPFLDIRAGSHA